MSRAEKAVLVAGQQWMPQLRIRMNEIYADSIAERKRANENVRLKKEMLFCLLLLFFFLTNVSS